MNLLEIGNWLLLSLHHRFYILSRQFFLFFMDILIEMIKVLHTLWVFGRMQKLQSSFSLIIFAASGDCIGLIGGNWSTSSMELSLPLIVVLRFGNVGVCVCKVEGLWLSFRHLRLRPFFWLIVSGFRHWLCSKFLELLVLFFIWQRKSLALLTFW